MGLPARQIDGLPRIQRGTDEWGNTVWFFFDHAIRVDESGPEPMFVFRDCAICNGLNPNQPTKRPEIQKEMGHASFTTPGGPQSLRTISEQGFYVLTMRGQKPASEQFRRWMAEVAAQLRKTGHVDMRQPAAMPVAPQSAMDILRQTMLAQQQMMAANLQLLDQVTANGQRVGELEARVERIEQQGEEATREMMKLPAPSVAPPARTDRHNIVEWVRGYCWSTKADFKACFGKLYIEVKYRLGVDVNARFRNNPELYENKLDVLDSAGLLDKVYALARELFPWEPRMAE